MRTIGGIKKVLGSKAGLLHKLGDDSMLKYLSDDDIDMFASKLTAPALKNQRNQVTATLKQMRNDTHKRHHRGRWHASGWRCVKPSPTCRPCPHPTNERSTTRLRTVSRFRGTDRGRQVPRPIHRRHPTPRPTRQTRHDHREYDKARKVFTNLLETKTKRFNELEKLHGQVEVTSLRRSPTVGNHTATSEQPRSKTELRRVAAETAGDRPRHGVGRDDPRTGSTSTRKPKASSTARLGDSDFINLAVADNLSPKSPGASTGADTPPPPVYVGPSPAEDLDRCQRQDDPDSWGR